MLSLQEFSTRMAVLGMMLACSLTAAAGGQGGGFAGVAAAPEARGPSYVLKRGMFLVASRHLVDPNFSHSVVLVLEYDAKGALGLIVNKPTRLQLSELLPEVEELKERVDIVYVGGPVSKDHVLLLMRSQQHPPHSGRVFADTYVSTSLESLRNAVAAGAEGAHFRAYVGYAGWGPGQLDSEVSRGDWHVAPADEATVFDTGAEKIWPELIEKNSGQWVRRRSPHLQVAGALP